MKELVIVGLGGFVGSASRYAIYLAAHSHFQDKSYMGTLIVNLVGCLVIGVLGGSITKINSQISLFLMAGLCGGFTTFSSFALDGLKLLRDGIYFDFFLYLSASTTGGLLLCFLGYYLGHRFS